MAGASLCGLPFAVLLAPLLGPLRPIPPGASIILECVLFLSGVLGSAGSEGGMLVEAGQHSSGDDNGWS